MTDLSATHRPATAATPQEAISLAGELAAYARAAHDAIAMLEAARMLLPLPREAFAPGSATPAMLFAEARILAEGDAGLLAEIDWIQHGRKRAMQIVAGTYAAKTWVVRHAGDGTALTPVVSTIPPLRNVAASWGVTFTGQAA